MTQGLLSHSSGYLVFSPVPRPVYQYELNTWAKFNLFTIPQLVLMLAHLWVFIGVQQ